MPDVLVSIPADQPMAVAISGSDTLVIGLPAQQGPSGPPGTGSGIHVGTTPPTTPVDGALWFDTSASVPLITVGTTPPANPSESDIWIDTN